MHSSCPATTTASRVRPLPPRSTPTAIRRSVCAVVATAGTTNAGLVDDLAGVAGVCEAAGPLDARRRRVRRRRAARAECARTLRGHRTRRLVGDRPPQVAVRALRLRRAHLPRAGVRPGGAHAGAFVPRRDPRGRPAEWNPSDYAYQLTRRARGLPLWFSLAVNGSDAYRDAIERVLATARAAAERITALPHLELVREPELSVVLFRRKGWERSRLRSVGRRDLLAEQIAFVAPSRWHDEPVARLAFLHPETTLDHRRRGPRDDCVVSRPLRRRPNRQRFLGAS